jgi:hypothetical protein
MTNVQRVVRGIGDEFTEVEKTNSHTFLPAIFSEDLADDDHRLTHASLQVEHDGLASPAPNQAKPRGKHILDMVVARTEIARKDLLPVVPPISSSRSNRDRPPIHLLDRHGRSFTRDRPKDLLPVVPPV